MVNKTGKLKIVDRMRISDWMRDHRADVAKLSATEAKAAVKELYDIKCSEITISRIAKERNIELTRKRADRSPEKVSASSHVRDATMAKILRKVCQSMSAVFGDEFDFTQQEYDDLTTIIGRKSPVVAEKKEEDD